MCYESAQLAERIYRDAIRAGATQEELEYLRRNWEEKKRHKPSSKYYHVSGFEHPQLIALYKKDEHLEIDHFTWGLIPHWVKDENQATDIWNKTLNARGESIFEKPSFKEAAENSRVVIPLDGFFEHHHKNGKTFPHYIQQSDGENMLVAGLSSNWTNPSTGEIVQSLSIVTTKGNELMSEIHNNSKLKGPRMPLILDENNVQTWLEGNSNDIEKLIKPSEVAITAHTVRRLKGRNALGNVPEAHEEYQYPEMEDPLTLF